MQADDSSFGEKVFEASCKAVIPPRQAVDAIAEVWTQGLAVKPNTGNTIFLPYTDASKVDTSNFRATFATQSSAISLLQFGSKFDQFAREITRRYSDAMSRALLMDEPTVVYEAPGSYSWTSGSSKATGECRARIYGTALVILASNSTPIRISFSFITSVDLQGYKLVITSTQGALELSRLGNATEFFTDKLREAMRDIEATTIETIKSMVPSATYEELSKLSWPMLEGRAAPRKVVEKISPDLWDRLELSVNHSALAETYKYLLSIGERSLVSVGFRKTPDGVYVWFLIPVMGSVQNGGNANVFEVISESGHATYLFWVISRAEFANTTREKFAQDAEAEAHDLNEAIVATGFRREPIYLSYEQLNTPEYGKYLYASANLEPLKFLRERFFARIIHSDLEQWKQDLSEALLFNVSSSDSSARWQKNNLEFVEGGGARQGNPAMPLAPQTQVPIATPAPPDASIPKTETVQALKEVDSNRIVLEKVFTLRNMEADDRGNVKLLMHDSELDANTEIWVTGEQASQLGAFPGAKVKIAIQKV